MDSEEFKVRAGNAITPRNVQQLTLGRLVKALVNSEIASHQANLRKMKHISEGREYHPEEDSMIDSLERSQKILYQELDRREQQYRNGQ